MSLECKEFRGTTLATSTAPSSRSAFLVPTNQDGAGACPPLHPLNRQNRLLSSEHDPGLRRLGALPDAHEIDPGRRGATGVILAVPADFVCSRSRRVLAERPNQLAVDR